MSYVSPCLFSVVLILLAPGALLAQVPADAPKKPAESGIAIQLKELNDAVMDRKVAHDEAAINIIDKLLSGAETLPAKDKEAFIAALSDIFTKAKAREPEKKGLYVAAATALSRFGAQGAAVLVKAFGDEKFAKKEWLDMRGDILRNLGKTKDETQVKFLAERITRSTDDAILKAAGEALGNYDDRPVGVRKEICKEMITKYNGIANQANSSVDPGNVQAKASRDTLAVVTDPWNTTLGKLTKQEFRSAPEWQKWWNKNKAADWDKLKK